MSEELRNEEEVVETKTYTQDEVDEMTKGMYTKEQVDEIIDKKFARWKENEEKEKQKLKLSEKERQELKTKELIEELENVKREKRHLELTGLAKSYLESKGLVVGDKLLSAMIKEDEEKTTETLDEFLTAFNELLEKQVTERLKGKTPPTFTGSKPYTKEEIMNIKDDAERKRVIAENLHLFGK